MIGHRSAPLGILTSAAIARPVARPIALLPTIALALLACAPENAPTQETTADAAPRPNIIVILADDLGYGDLSAFGATLFETPNIDRLAREGVTLTNWYAGSNVCTPSRAALLTGRYAPRSRTQFVTRPHSTWGMSPDEVTIAEVLGETGYATGMIGKWHLGHRLEYWPTNQGFDSFLGVAYSNDMAPFDLYRGVEKIETGIDQSKLTARYAEEAVRFIRAHRDAPFFLYYAESFPHYPATPAERNVGRTRAGLYGDTVVTIDDAVGSILEALETEGISDDTLMLFTSDNGPWFQGSAGPLRSRKGATYEGGYRVPFVARWPARIPAGLVNDQMAMAIDLLPTLAHLGGGSVPEDRVIDGRNITTMWTEGAGTPHDALYFFDANDLAAVRDARFKLVLKSYYRSFAVPFRQFAGVKLFDLQADPSESYDVGSRHPDVLQRLLGLAEQMEEIVGPMASEPDPAPPPEGAVLGPQLGPQ